MWNEDKGKDKKVDKENSGQNAQEHERQEQGLGEATGSEVRGNIMLKREGMDSRTPVVCLLRENFDLEELKRVEGSLFNCFL